MYYWTVSYAIGYNIWIYIGYYVIEYLRQNILLFVILQEYYKIISQHNTFYNTVTNRWLRQYKLNIIDSLNSLVIPPWKNSSLFLEKLVTF